MSHVHVLAGASPLVAPPPVGHARYGCAAGRPARGTSSHIRSPVAGDLESPDASASACRETFSDVLRAAPRERTPPPQADSTPSASAASSIPVPPEPAPVCSPGAAPDPAGIADLWPALVRRIAWSCDARRSCVRLELGAGALAGAVLLLLSEDGRVQVKLSAPPGVDLDAWRVRIAGRLASRGVPLDGVDVE